MSSYFIQKINFYLISQIFCTLSKCLMRFETRQRYLYLINRKNILSDDGAINKSDADLRTSRTSTLRNSIRRISGFYNDNAKLMKKMGGDNDEKLEKDIELSRRSTDVM
jgi:hypothetical protein